MTSLFSEIKHIFFDLDDTLWDFNRNSSNVLRELFEEHCLNEKLMTDFMDFHSRYKEVNFELWKKYSLGEINKKHLREQRFHVTFEHFGYSNFDENLSFTRKYLERAPQGKHLKPYCIDALTHLKKKYKLHIITNGFAEIQDIKIDGCGLRPFFDKIIVSEMYGVNKPSRKIFLIAQKLAGSDPQNSVMIGDNHDTDIAGANEAGWKTIHLTDSDESTAHRRIRTLDELLKIL